MRKEKGRRKGKRKEWKEWKKGGEERGEKARHGDVLKFTILIPCCRAPIRQRSIVIV